MNLKPNKEMTQTLIMLVAKEKGKVKDAKYKRKLDILEDYLIQYCDYWWT